MFPLPFFFFFFFIIITCSPPHVSSLSSFSVCWGGEGLSEVQIWNLNSFLFQRMMLYYSFLLGKLEHKISASDRLGASFISIQFYVIHMVRGLCHFRIPQAEREKFKEIICCALPELFWFFHYTYYFCSLRLLNYSYWCLHQGISSYKMFSVLKK